MQTDIHEVSVEQSPSDLLSKSSKNAFDEFVKKLGPGTVYGELYEKGGKTYIPVAKVRGGGGKGTGKKGSDETSGGVGFGMNATPAGMYVIDGEDTKWIPAVDQTRVATMGIVSGIVSMLVIRSIVKMVIGRRRSEAE